MLYRLILTLTYVLALLGLMEVGPGLTHFHHDDVILNESIDVALRAVGLPLFLGALLGAFRRDNMRVDYIPFAVAPVLAFLVSSALLNARFEWVAVPLWAIASLSSVAGAWFYGKLLVRTRRRQSSTLP